MPSPDPFLESIVAGLGDSMTERLPLTISCGGIAVTGRLVSFARYRQRLSESFERWMGEDAPEVDRAASQTNTLPDEQTGYLHMIDARVVTGISGFPSVEPYFEWRCPLSSVEGFAFGRMIYHEEIEEEEREKKAEAETKREE